MPRNVLFLPRRGTEYLGRLGSLCLLLSVIIRERGEEFDIEGRTDWSGTVTGKQRR